MTFSIADHSGSFWTSFNEFASFGNFSSFMISPQKSVLTEMIVLYYSIWTQKCRLKNWNRPKGYFPTTVPIDKNVASAKSARVILSPTRKIFSPFIDLKSWWNLHFQSAKRKKKKFSHRTWKSKFDQSFIAIFDLLQSFFWFSTTKEFVCGEI